MSIADYITQLRLEEAKTLLTATKLPIIQIIRECSTSKKPL